MNQKERKQSTYGRAQVIAASRKIVKSDCGPLWSVESEVQDGKMYQVVYVDGEIKCNCLAYQNGMNPCKHCLSVALIEVC